MSYHKARYYLPWLGRWGSVDPKFIYDSLNLYKYSSNNPVCYIDLNGTNGRRKELLMHLLAALSMSNDPTEVRSTNPDIPENERSERTERRRLEGERSRVDESEEMPERPRPIEPEPALRRRRPTYSRPEESRPPITSPRRPSITRGGGVNQRQGIGGRRAGYAHVGTLLTILDFAFLTSAVIAARSPVERMRVIGEWGLNTAAGIAAVRYFGGPAGIAVSVVSLPSDQPDFVLEQQRRREEEYFRTSWRQHVNELSLQLAEHLQQFDAALTSLEGFLDEHDRIGGVMSSEYRTSRLNELSFQLATARDRIVRDLGQLTWEDLPYVRELLVKKRGVSNELVQDVFR